MVKCVVHGCSNRTELRSSWQTGCSRSRKRFFSFPVDPDRAKAWLAALHESVRSSTDNIICEDHFLPEHITPSGISSDAIPMVSLEGAVPDSADWTSPVEPTDEPSEAVEENEIPIKQEDEKEEDENEQEDDDDDDDDEDYDDDEEEEEEEYEDLDSTGEEPLPMDKETEQEWLTTLQENLKTSMKQKERNVNQGITEREAVRKLTIGRLTRRFIDLLHSAPEGILDLDEATEKLGTCKRRVYDITNALNGVKLIAKISKNKIQWVGSSPISSFKCQWQSKLKDDLLNLKTMEESLDWLIKDCAQQLFALTENASSAYVTYDDISQIAAFQNQTVIAVKAPEETRLEVPTPTEECIKIHLKGSRGPIHVLTCETNGSDATSQSQQLINGHFRTLEESRIETAPLTDLPSISSAVRCSKGAENQCFTGDQPKPRQRTASIL